MNHDSSDAGFQKTCRFHNPHVHMPVVRGRKQFRLSNTINSLLDRSSLTPTLIANTPASNQETKCLTPAHEATLV